MDGRDGEGRRSGGEESWSSRGVEAKSTTSGGGDFVFEVSIENITPMSD